MKQLLRAIVKIHEHCKEHICDECPFQLSWKHSETTTIKYCGVTDLMGCLQDEPCDWDIDRIIEVLIHE